MAITIEETLDGRGLTYIGEGALTGQELLDAIDRVRSFGEKPHHWLFCLHDFTAMETLACSSDDIRAVAQKDKNLLALIFPAGSVIAVVTPKDHHYGLARMWQVYAEETKWETGVFRSRIEAEQWIREQVWSGFGIKVLSLEHR